MKKYLNSTKLWSILVVAVGLAGLGLWQRDSLRAWHAVRQLSQADEETRDALAAQVAELEEAAFARVFASLRDRDPRVCENLQCPLLMVAKRWGLADERTHDLVERLRQHFDDFSPAAREQVVLMVSCLLREEGPRPLPPRLTKAVGEILVTANKQTELLAASLRLAAELVDGVEAGQWVSESHEMVDRGLKDESSAARVAALQLLAREPMRKDKDRLERTIPLLRDPDAAIRKGALLLLAAESELVREENFLPLLHDEDAELQHLAVMALRKRNLTDDDIAIARMISAPEASTRMRVLHHLHRLPDLNLGGLLRQLSHDPSPAVRAAAARAAADYPHVELSERLREMATDDPSETVRQQARFYLDLRTRRAAIN